MGIEIRIDSSDMLKVLVNGGMEVTEAKAIIFDLIQYPDKENTSEKRVKEVKNNKLPKKSKNPLDEESASSKENNSKEADKDDSTEDDDQEDEEDDEQKGDNYQILKRPKRITFKNFGGVASPLAASVGRVKQ